MEPLVYLLFLSIFPIGTIEKSPEVPPCQQANTATYCNYDCFQMDCLTYGDSSKSDEIRKWQECSKKHVIKLDSKVVEHYFDDKDQYLSCFNSEGTWSSCICRYPFVINNMNSNSSESCINKNECRTAQSADQPRIAIMMKSEDNAMEEESNIDSSDSNAKINNTNNRLFGLNTYGIFGQPYYTLGGYGMGGSYNTPAYKKPCNSAGYPNLLDFWRDLLFGGMKKECKDKGIGKGKGKGKGKSKGKGKGKCKGSPECDNDDDDSEDNTSSTSTTRKTTVTETTSSTSAEDASTTEATTVAQKSTVAETTTFAETTVAEETTVAA